MERGPRTTEDILFTTIHQPNQHTPGKIPKNDEWTIQTKSVHTLTKTRFIQKLRHLLSIPKAHTLTCKPGATYRIQAPSLTQSSCDAVPPLRKDANRTTGNTQKKSTQTWLVKFTNDTLHNLWSHSFTPWKIPTTLLQFMPQNKPVFYFATGWHAYRCRITRALLREEEGDFQSDDTVNRVLQTYTHPDGNFESPGHNANTSTDLWHVVKTLLYDSAAKSFGHYVNLKINKPLSTSSQIYKWATNLSKLLKLFVLEEHPIWRNDLIDLIRLTTDKIPITSLEPTKHDKPNEWATYASDTLKQIKHHYLAFRQKEISDNQRRTRRNIHAWFVNDIGRYLDHTIRIPDPHSGGLQWPKDEHGEIPLQPQDRLDIHKSIWQEKFESRCPTPNLENKQWLKELLNTPSSFTESMSQELTNLITSKELENAYKNTKTKAAPGPSGIRNVQYKQAPARMQLIILDMMNNMYDTSNIPTDLKEGIIYPIPKDTQRPCTSDNARPLTMLETGLKLFTQILANRITKLLSENQIYAPTQYAFLPQKTIMDPLRLIEAAQSSARNQSKEIHHTFMDLTQAFDRLEYWASDLALHRMKYPTKFKKLIQNLNTDSNRCIITTDGNTTPWKLQCGVAQGEVLSPIRFITVMDMLATWLAMRANKCNPKEKQMGYDISPKTTRHRQSVHTSKNKVLKPILSSLLYCDDIALTTDNFDDMQDLVGVISEFMSTFGIQINNKKSFYTMKTSQPTHSQHPITQSPTTTGVWHGGINGYWTPASTDKHNVTIKQVNEPIRYLGVHFTLNGDWSTQHRILLNIVKTSLNKIRRQDLTPNQLMYLINAVILPKLTYPLNVVSVLMGKGGPKLISDIDNLLRDFVKMYLQLPSYINNNFFYTPETNNGLGMKSLEHECYTNIITNTLVTLNDWHTLQYWKRQSSGLTSPTKRDPNQQKTTIQANQDTFSTYQLRSFEKNSNVFSQTLLCLTQHYSSQNNHKAFCMGAYHKGSKSPDEIVENLIYCLTSMGYAIKPNLSPQEVLCPTDHPYHETTRPRPDAIHPIRCIPKHIYDKISKAIMTHNISDFAFFTLPCGTHLEAWETYSHTHTRKTKPQWYVHLENETLIPGSKCRTLKPCYRVKPSPITLSEPFCFNNDECLYACETLQTSQDQSIIKVKLHILIRDTTDTNDLHPHQNTETKEILITLLNGTFTKDQGAIISLQGILTKDDLNRGNTKITTHTYDALRNQCLSQTILQETEEAVKEDSIGSMESLTNTSSFSVAETIDIRSRDTVTTRRRINTTHDLIQHAHMKFDSCSDGSVTTLQNTTIAGYAAVITPKNSPPIILRNTHHDQPKWTSNTTVLKYNPISTSSTEMEAFGLLLTLQHLNQNPGTPETQHDENSTSLHTHAIDNQGVIHQINQQNVTLSTRQSLRENNHITLNAIRESLSKLRYYHTNPKIKVQWIKGHCGNRIHDVADRHAKRISFRNKSDTQLLLTPHIYPFSLYFYECHVSQDVRSHINKVSKHIHLNKWMSKQTQGLTPSSIHLQNLRTHTIKHTKRNTRDTAIKIKLLNSITYTPKLQQKIGRAETGTCPLCKTPDADENHVLFQCPEESLTKIRQDMENAILDKLEITSYVLAHTYTKKPLRHSFMGTTNEILYPLCPRLHSERRILTLHALPEARWYRHSNSFPDCITIQDPRYQDDGDSDALIPHYRLLKQTFWNMICWHDMTDAVRYDIAAYDNRASDIFQAITQNKEQSGPSSFCWATPRDLLDIFIDDIGCTEELFSNIENTYHRFEGRRMLYVPPPFATKANILLNGLLEDAYCGCVYGNPPFDGKTTGNNTIKKMLNAAQRACITRVPFRGVFVIPLSPGNLKHRLTFPHVSVLFKFPDNTLPFISAKHWRTGCKTTGFYKNPYTNIVILLYNSPNQCDLPPLNIESIQKKLAIWYLKTAPRSSHTQEFLNTTMVPLNFFEHARHVDIPESWKFWKNTAMCSLDTCTADLSTPYPGQSLDLVHANITPVRDIVYLHRKSAALGFLPQSFGKFAASISTSTLTPYKITKHVSDVLSRFTVRLIRRYTHLSSLQASTPPTENPSHAIVSNISHSSTADSNLDNSFYAEDTPDVLSVTPCG